MTGAMSHPFSRRLRRALASSVALVALAAPASAQALVGSSSTAATSARIPVPASAKLQPGAVGGAAAPGTTAPSTAATTTSQALPAAAASPPTPTSTTTSSPAPAAAPAPVGAKHRAEKLSTGAIVAAAVGGLIALVCAAWGVARLQAFEPHWTRSARHAIAEAGFRASSTWAEFSDWVRLGR
jgi:hypothetical protein